MYTKLQIQKISGFFKAATEWQKEHLLKNEDTIRRNDVCLKNLFLNKAYVKAGFGKLSEFETGILYNFLIKMMRDLNSLWQFQTEALCLIRHWEAATSKQVIQTDLESFAVKKKYILDISDPRH